MFKEIMTRKKLPAVGCWWLGRVCLGGGWLRGSWSRGKGTNACNQDTGFSSWPVSVTCH